MPSSVLFPRCHSTSHQQGNSEARASSVWHGLVVCPQLYMWRLCVPWGKALLLSGSWFPYQIKRISLDRFYMPLQLYSKVLFQCKFTHIYTHTFYLLHKSQATKQAFGLSEFPTPLSSSRTTHCLPIKSSTNSFSRLSRSCYHRTPFLMLSLIHLHLLAHCAPQVPKSSLHFPTCFWSFFFIKTLPVSVVGGGWEASPVLPAYHMHMWCHQGSDTLGNQVHVPLSQFSHSAQLSTFEYI